MSNEDVRASAAMAVFDVLDDVVAVVAVDEDAGYPVVDANPALSRSTGYTLDDVLGRPLAELQPPEAVNGFLGRVDEVLRTGQPERYQVDREVPAGHVTLQVTLCPLPQPADAPPHVAVVLHDVTALRRVNDTLTEVERVTRTGTWTWEVASDRVRWSSQLYELFGLQRDELDPSFAGYLQQVHPDDRDEVEAIIGRTFETGEPFEIDHRVVTPTDEVRWLHCTGRRIDDLDGQPVRLTGTAQHVSPPAS